MHNNILFIGGGGFIGSTLIRNLYKQHRADCEIYVIEPTNANIKRLDGLDVHIYRGSLGDFDFVYDVIATCGITTVVHLVSTMVPGSSFEDYKSEFENVIFPTVRLMRLCGEKGIKFVFFSSGGTIYGEHKSDIPFVESDPNEPICYYGLSKQVIENSIIFEHRTSGLQYLILRPSNSYGPGQNLYGNQGLIAVSLGRILSGQPITVWGDGKSVRDYIHIDDLSFVFCRLLESGVANETINIGSGIGYSINDIISYLKECTCQKICVEYTAERKGDVSNMILNIDKLKSYIPNLSLKPLKEGILEFYLIEKSKKI